MPMLKKLSRLKPPPGAVVAALDAVNDLSGDWREFTDIMTELGPRDRTVILSIMRKVHDVEAQHGVDVAEATLERLIQVLSNGEPQFII